MKILVCGGRDFADVALVRTTLAAYGAGHVLIHGGAPGADTLAGTVARELGWRVVQYHADWSLGRSAGPRRNALMLAHNPDVDLVLAFAGGPGTADMLRRARRAGLGIVTA